MLFVAGLAVLGSVAILSVMQIGTLKQRLTGKEQELATMLAQNESLKQELADLETEQKSLEGRLNDLRGQLTTSTAERERIRASMDELQTRFKALQDENGRFQAQIDRLNKERDEVSAQLQQVQKDKAALEQAATRLRNRFAFLDRDYRQLESAFTDLKQAKQSASAVQPTARYEPPAPITRQPLGQAPIVQSGQGGETPPPADAAGGGTRPSIELAPIVVRRAQAEVMRSLQGRVVEVNEIHQFVVIDKGSEDGVQIGATFDVLRGGAMVGQIVVIRVQPRLGAAEIVPARTTGIPQVGDRVIKRES